ncbi:MAG: trypsin-like serine protease [Alphaproteobacteria bacterium]|nr:trypsin-like serine protease [Alphaproteobacteria bacterium]
MRTLAALCAFIWAAIAAPAAAQSVDLAEASAVRVALIADTFRGRYLVGTGSGFVVAPNLVVTNAHVVAPQRQYQGITIAVVPPQGSGLRTARIVRYSPTNDLALLRFDGESPPALSISQIAPRAGDAIVALGYPDMDDIDRPAVELVRPTAPSRSSGSIASLRDRAPTGDPIPTINHEAVISSGSSGGPLLDQCGRVIGVNTWHARGRDTLEGRGVATRAEQLVQFLSDAGVPPSVTDRRCLSAVEVAQAERDAAVAAAQAQNRALEAKLERAESLMRTTLIAVAAGGAALIALIGGGLGYLLLRRRPRSPPPSEPHAQTPYEQTPRARPPSRMTLVIGGAALAAILVVLAIIFVLGPLRSPPEAPPALGARDAGVQTCAVDRSQTQTEDAVDDTSFSIDANACVNGRTQYAADNAGVLRRILLSPQQQTLDVLSFNPRSGDFRRERYALDKSTLPQATEAADDAPAPSGCAPHADARSRAETARQVARRNAALSAFVQGEPQERVVWRCRREP